MELWHTKVITHNLLSCLLDAEAESVERRPRLWEIGSLVPSRVNPMTYEIDTVAS